MSSGCGPLDAADVEEEGTSGDSRKHKAEEDSPADAPVTAAPRAAAWAESEPLICPAVLEVAKAGVEREPALSQAPVQAREASAALAEKDCK